MNSHRQNRIALLLLAENYIEIDQMKDKSDA